MRKEDICGRYGGEEFGILLPETPKLSALRLAEKIRKLIKRSTFTYADKEIHVTISLGVAFLAKEVRTSEQFVEMADQALYQAKKDGRDCVRS